MRTHCISCILLCVLCLPSNTTLAQTEISDSWRYTTEVPANGWFESNFDAQDWQQGAGGFGTRNTPNARIGTVWNSDDIWLRKEFTLSNIPDAPALYIHHDEDAEVFVMMNVKSRCVGNIAECEFLA